MSNGQFTFAGVAACLKFTFIGENSCKSFCSLLFHYLVTSSILALEMGFSHLLKIKATLDNFRARFAIPPDVNVAYCHEDSIALEWCPQVVFFPLMSIFEGGVRFPVDPLILRTLRFYGLHPDQLPPNFY